MCWLQTSAFHTCCHPNAYFALLNVVVLPGDHFLPCLLTITGSFFGAKHELPVCVLLPIIRMQFSGQALAWLHKAASTLKKLLFIKASYAKKSMLMECSEHYQSQIYR